MEGLLRSIFYKKVPAETVVRDGKKYKKYKRVPRFNFRKVKIILFVALFLLLTAAITAFIFYRPTHSLE